MVREALKTTMDIFSDHAVIKSTVKKDKSETEIHFDSYDVVHWMDDLWRVSFFMGGKVVARVSIPLFDILEIGEGIVGAKQFEMKPQKFVSKANVDRIRNGELTWKAIMDVNFPNISKRVNWDRFERNAIISSL